MLCRSLPMLRAIFEAARENSHLGNQPEIFKYRTQHIQSFLVSLGVIRHKSARNLLTHIGEASVSDGLSYLPCEWLFERWRSREQRTTAPTAPATTAASSVISTCASSPTFLETSIPHRALVDNALLPILARSKWFVYAILPWALTGKHFCSTLLSGILRGLLFVAEATWAAVIVATWAAIIVAAWAAIVVTAWTAVIITTRATLTPVTAKIITTRAAVVITARAALTAVTAKIVATRTAVIITARATLTAVATKIVTTRAAVIITTRARIYVAFATLAKPASARTCSIGSTATRTVTKRSTTRVAATVTRTSSSTVARTTS